MFKWRIRARRWPKVEVKFAQRLRTYSSINPRSGQCLFDGRFSAVRPIKQPSTEELIWVGPVVFQVQRLNITCRYRHRKYRPVNPPVFGGSLPFWRGVSRPPVFMSFSPFLKYFDLLKKNALFTKINSVYQFICKKICLASLGIVKWQPVSSVSFRQFRRSGLLKAVTDTLIY